MRGLSALLVPRSAGAAERLARCLPAASYCLVIFTLSSIPGKDVPAVGVDDRLGHFLEYFGLGFLLMVAAAGWGSRLGFRHFAASWWFAALFALSDEWHQSFVANRDSSFSDVLFDMAGSTVALGLVWLLSRESVSH